MGTAVKRRPHLSPPLDQACSPLGRESLPSAHSPNNIHGRVQCASRNQLALPARGLEAHPMYLVLRTQAGRSGAASTAPWLRQPQWGRGREFPLWTDDFLLSTLLNFAFRGELP